MFTTKDLTQQLIGRPCLTRYYRNTDPPLPPDINMLSPQLDSRITYAGPAHMYWAKNGVLTMSQANEWPLQYRDGVAIGRHEPEFPAINYQPDNSGIDTIAGKTSSIWYPIGSLSAMQSTPAPDGRTGVAFDPALNQEAVRVSGGGAFYYGPVAYTPGDKWTRRIIKTTNQGNQRLQLIPGYQNDGNQLIARSETMPIGPVTASYFCRKLADGRIAVALLQIESRNTATSPIVTPTAGVANRLPSSARVARVSPANGINIVFDTGEEVYRAFGDSDSIVVSLASGDWGSRYITRIQYVQ